MATERRLVKLIQENLRLITQRQRLADDEPIVTLQVGAARLEGGVCKNMRAGNTRRLQAVIAPCTPAS